MKRNTVISFDMGNIRIKVSLRGFWSGGDKTNSLKHNHTNFEYHMVLQGSAKFDTDDGSYILNQNDSVLVLPYSFHRFSSQDKDSAILSFAFSLNKTAVKSAKDYYTPVFDRIDRESNVLLIRQNIAMADELRKITANIYSDRLFSDEETKALFMLLFSQLLSCLTETESRSHDEENEPAEYDARVFMIEEYFNEYYMENITLKQLSELLGLSEKQTDRMINKAFGEGFQQHLCRMRLKIAQDLLRNTDMEVKQIAETVGYRSYNGFYLAFKRNLGCTPLEYKNKQQNSLHIL